MKIDSNTFRVWHKIEKRFVELRSIDFEKDSIGYDAHREANYYDIASFNDVTFQQFTGIKDRNDKPIYEGDIIKGYHLFGPAGWKEIQHPIYWDDKKGGYEWDYWNLDTVEIIGNIFENE